MARTDATVLVSTDRLPVRGPIVVHMIYGSRDLHTDDMYWGNNSHWKALPPVERAAAMALLEADQKAGKIDLEAARNVAGAIVNRAAKSGADIGEHVSKKIYQPTIEDAQFARLSKIIGSPEHKQMIDFVQRRMAGEEPDPVGGATHFLARESTMTALQRQNPDKYHNWGPFPNSRGRPGANWTGYDPQTGEYKGVITRDASHAFLAPEGPFSATTNPAATPTAASQPTPAPVASAMPASTQATPVVARPSTTTPTSLAELIGNTPTTPAPTSFTEMIDGMGMSGSTGTGFGISGSDTKLPNPLNMEEAPDPLRALGGKPVDVMKLMAVLSARSMGRLGTA